MPKRNARLILLLLALCLLLTSACGRAKKAPANYRVAIATDLHYLSPDLNDGGELFQRVLDAGDGKVTECCEEITDAFLAEVLRFRPEALILTGDLSFNGERESHLALAEKLAAVEAAGVPVLVLPGNHDLYRGSYAFRGETAEPVPSVTAEEFREIYASFGFDEALARDQDSLSYVARLNAGTLVLMLDANSLEAPCGLSDETLDWVESQLRQADRDGRQVLAACHQNLFQHSPLFGPGYVVNGGEKLAALLEQHRVPLFLSGHLHIQHIVTQGAVTEIATSSLSMGVCHYALLEAEDGVIRYEARPVPVSDWAAAQGLTAPRLTNFSDYAAERMLERNRIQAKEHMADRGYDDEELQRLADYAAVLNLAYFSGDLTGLADLDPDGAMLARLSEGGSFFAVYYSSIAQEIGRNYTRWSSEESPG